MSYFANASRTIVIKANRETIGLVLAASAMTFAIAYSVHSKPTPVATQAQQQDWAGDLAELAPQKLASTESMSSADLVVPNAQLALPSVPVKQATKRGCDEPCLKVPVPPRRETAREVSPILAPRTKEPSLLTRLNPLNHVPKVVKQPFNYAGDMVSGWIKRF